MEQSVAQPKPREAIILSQIQQVSNGMTGWLKFIGIMNIVFAGLSIISSMGVAIIIAWLPIWLGVILLQAANRITNARFANNQGELVQMMDKLRLYFVIEGVLLIILLIVMVLGLIIFLIFGGMFFQLMQNEGFNSF